MPGVKGTFEVDNRASGPLRDMRTDAQTTKQAFRDLGSEMDRLGADTSNLDRYKRSLSSMGDTGVRSLGELSDSWDRTAASTARSVEAMKGEMDDLQLKLKEVGDTHARPDVDVRGIDESIAKIELLQAKLKELDHQRSTPRVSTGGGGMSGFTGSGSISSMGGVSGPLSSVANDTEGLLSGIPQMAKMAAVALPVVQSLGGATAALVSSMSGAALGAGGVSLAAGGALTVGLASFMAVAKPALSSIESVWKAQTSLTQAQQQAVMPGMQQTQQLRQVVQAENALQQAQVQSRMAQIALTEARRQARNQLTNLGLDAQSAALGEKQAALTLASSQRALYEAQTSPTSTPLQIQQAELAVRQAQLGIKQSSQQAKEARESLVIGRREGTGSGNPTVASAEQSSQQSVLAIRNARWSLEEARKTASGGGSSVEQARLAYNYALQHAPAGTRQLVESGKAFVKEWKDATHGASSDFVGMLGGALSTFRAMMPTLAGASNRDTHAMASAGGAFGQFLQSGQNQGFITTGSEMFSENLMSWEHALTNILGTVENIATAARPFLREASEHFQDWTAGWDRSTGDIAKTRSDLSKMVDDAKAWTKMWMEFWRLMHTIMVAGDANAQGTGLVTDMTKTMERWEAWVKENPQKVKQFFTETVEGAKALGGAIGHIAHSLNEVATQLQPLLKGGANILGLLNNTGLTSSVGGIGGLYGFYRGGRSVLGGGAPAGLTGGRVVASPAMSAMGGLAMGGFGMAGAGVVGGSMMGNVRTMPNVATVGPNGTIIVSSATGRPVSAGAAAITERELAAAGSPFTSIASSGAGRFSYIPQAFGAGASKLGGMAMGGLQMAAPYVLMNSALNLAAGQNPIGSSSSAAINAASIAALARRSGSTTLGLAGAAGSLYTLLEAAQGKNPFQSRSPLGAIGKTTAFGASTGAALGLLGGPLAEISSPIGALAGGLGGAIAGAGGVALHALGYRSGEEKAYEALQKLGKELKAVNGELSRLEPEQLAKLHAEAEKLAKSKYLSSYTGELETLIRQTGKSAQAAKEWSSQYNGATQAMVSASRRNLGEVQDVSRTTAEGIEQELGRGSTKAREQLARNFGTAAEVVQQRMRETGEFTKQGISIVNQELSKALGEYGLKAPKGVTTKQKAEVLKARQEGDKSAGFGAGGAAQDLTPAALAKQEGRAVGGRIPGMGTYDTVRMSDGGLGAPGELVVNRHTEAAANMGLWRAGMPSLAQMVGGETIPHSSPYRATGGVIGSHYKRLMAAANRVSAANFPYKWGGGHEQPSHFEPFDCSGSVSYAVQQAGYKVPTTVAQDVGGWGFPRGPGQVTIFYKGGPKAHTFMRIGGRYWGTSGFARQKDNGGAGWFERAPDPGYLSGFQSVHLPGLDSAGGAGALGQFINLKAPQISGTGLPGMIANAALSSYASSLSGFGNKKVEASPAGGMAGGGDPLLDTGFKGSWVQVAQQIARMKGWNFNDWMKVVSLESGGKPSVMNSIGAFGLGQFLPMNYGKYGPGSRPGSNSIQQIESMADYIGSRYHNPTAALAHENAFHWYGRGGRMGMGAIPFIGGYAAGGNFTTRPGQAVSFVAGEGSHVEDVSITPRKGQAKFPAGHASPTVEVTINVGDVCVPDVESFKDIIGEASDEAARKLIAALERRRDRKVAGMVAD